MLDTRRLSEVIFTAGVVFDNLRSTRLATESFLHSGDISGVTSRADLQLLEDLRDAAAVAMRIRYRGTELTSGDIKAINAAMTRSAALYPGVYRLTEDGIGVNTPYGVHMPPGIDDDGVQRLIDRVALAGQDGSSARQAAMLFVLLAKAQPFGDGNKRTALLAANTLLQGETILSVPYSEYDPQLAATFNDLLARAYVCDEVDPCVNYLLENGISL